MADTNRMQGLQTALANPRARLSLVAMGVILVVTVVILATFSGNDDVVMKSDVIPPTPPGAGPGVRVDGDPFYDAAVAQENQEGAQQARDSGVSFVPAPRAEVAPKAPIAPTAPVVDEPQPLIEYGDTSALQARQEEIRAAEEAHRQAVQAHAARMTEQIGLLSGRWRSGGGHFSIEPDIEASASQAAAPRASIASTAGPGTAESGTPLVMRGEMHLGITIGELVSDDITRHAQATILSGPLAGAEIFGKLEANLQAGAASGTIVFDAIRVPGGAGTLPIKAVAVDPRTRRASTVGDVDHHTMSRLGATALGAATGAYAEALSQGGRDENLVTGGFGDSIVQREAYTDGQIARIAGARTLQAVGSDIASRASRPPTITIANGTEIGILWLEDFIPGGMHSNQETFQ